jgi:hypothetical protein
MSDLAAALREAGHGDVAHALERKELVGRLRQAGRGDLADALEAGDQTPPAEEAEPTTEPSSPAAHEQLAQHRNAAQSKWLTLGGSRRSDDG